MYSIIWIVLFLVLPVAVHAVIKAIIRRTLPPTDNPTCVQCRESKWLVVRGEQYYCTNCKVRIWRKR